MTISSWKEVGKYVSIEGNSLFVNDTGSAQNTIVILHGYPTSSYDYRAVLPILSKNFRVVIHDHLGFGLSDKPVDYSYSLIEQTDRALLLWMKLGITHAHLVAHDYGTSVATEIIARRNMGFEPVKLDSLTLCNGSVHIELARLRLIQKLLRNKTIGPLIARLSSKRIFRKNMRELWFDKSKLSEEEIDAMWELLTINNGKSALPRITQYLRERELYWHRWVGALKKSTLKSNILWGNNDPITGGDIARVHHAEMPGSKLRILDNIGHYPMIENPELWARELLDLLG
ncbi:MAG: alpha/beta hydrolase [Leptospirales bacterium]|nr:alpha/beta hydrolase [Leptospirales bacterium]